jgi:hypothetical protein
MNIRRKRLQKIVHVELNKADNLISYMFKWDKIYCMPLGKSLKIRRERNYWMEPSHQDLRNVKFKPLIKNVMSNFVYYKYLKVI